MAAQAQQAQSAQQYLVTFGVPGLTHFWDPTTTSYFKIAEIYRHGADYNYEDVVWHAWGAICYLYFPQQALTPTLPRWAIDREAYRGYAQDLASTKPDLIVIKLTPGQAITGQMPETSSRDYLWIECKAAKEDHPSGWKNVLMQAVTRLQTAHPIRTIFLIVAVGWKCLYFVWDPSNTIVGQPRLFIRPANPGAGNSPQQWNIDQRIKAIGNTQWVNTVTGEITISRAMELDCWTTVQVAPGQIRTRNWHNLATVEQFLVSIQNAALQGLNPLRF